MITLETEWLTLNQGVIQKKKTTRFEEDEMEISDKLMDDGSEWNIGVHLGFKGRIYEGGTIQV